MAAFYARFSSEPFDIRSARHAWPACRRRSLLKSRQVFTYRERRRGPIGNWRTSTSIWSRFRRHARRTRFAPGSVVGKV